MLVCLTVAWRLLAYFILYIKSTSSKKKIKKIKNFGFMNKLFDKDNIKIIENEKFMTVGVSYVDEIQRELLT
jgi:hypothetical protein